MRRRAARLTGLVAAVAIAANLFSLSARSSPDATLQVQRVDAIGITVSDLDRAVAFYTGVLTFTKVWEREFSGRPYELLTGVFGARSRVARLRLGSEEIELTEFLAPRGRPLPDDVRANDRVFQHIAIVVRDLHEAYTVLRRHDVEHASTGPQRLPDWNPNAGGIGAFYFRSPDRHFLELIAFPPGKGDARWQRPTGPLFLGIDHTAIVVDDTDRALGLYRDILGLQVAGASENYDVEQEHLNNVFGARLRITALRAPQGPGIELLEYLAPRDGRAAPADLRANDIAHWQTTLVTEGLDALLPLARRHALALVSPAPIAAFPAAGFRVGALVRDADGHGLRIVGECASNDRLRGCGGWHERLTGGQVESLARSCIRACAIEQLDAFPASVHSGPWLSKPFTARSDTPGWSTNQPSTLHVARNFVWPRSISCGSASASPNCAAGFLLARPSRITSSRKARRTSMPVTHPAVSAA